MIWIVVDYHVFHRLIWAIVELGVAGWNIWSARYAYGWERALWIALAIVFALSALIEAAAFGQELGR